MISIMLADLDRELTQDIVSRVLQIAAAATANANAKRDWRPDAEKALAQVFPNGWTYRGGSHVALHASPPKDPRRGMAQDEGRAGQRLLMLVECHTRSAVRFYYATGPAALSAAPAVPEGGAA